MKRTLPCPLLLTYFTTLLLTIPAANASYHLAFSDDFNDFNPSLWISTDFWGIRNNAGDYQGQWFCDPSYVPPGSNLKPYNPFTYQDGILRIRAIPTPEGTYAGAPQPNKNPQPYVSGMLSTAHRYTQRYGYFEMRAKLPPGKGMWSRFWLLTDNGVWPGEYDIFEVLGKEDPVTVHQTTHYRDQTSSHGVEGMSYKDINPVDGKFHTYGFLWTPETVTWYVDGVATQTQPNRIHIPMYTLIDLVVGKDPGNLWPGNPDSSTHFPADMEADYFRIYSNDESLPAVALPQGATPSMLPKEVALNPQPKPATLPAGWSATDVGAPELKGSSIYSPANGEWTLRGAGQGIVGGGQFQMARTTLKGDGAVVATVVDAIVVNSNDLSTGVMIRASDAGNAAEISLLYQTSFHAPKSSQQLILQVRASDGGESKVVTVPDIKKPVKLRVARTGNLYLPSYSYDEGATWTPVGEPLALSMPEETLAGIVVGGNQNNYRRISRSNLMDVSVGKITPSIMTNASSVVTAQTTECHVALTDAAGAAVKPEGPVKWSVVKGGGSIDSKGVYTAPPLVGLGNAVIKAEFASYSVLKTLRINLPSPWTLPVLKRTPRADAGVVSDAVTLIGGGKGISTDGKEDLFQFLPSLVTGNQTITVRLDQSNAAQAGIAIRDAYTPNSQSAGADVRSSGIWRTPTGLEWAARETSGKATGSMARLPITTLPIWLKLERSKELEDRFVFTASYSTDGSTWNSIGNPRTFAMSAEAAAGLVIASGSASSTSKAVFSNIRFTGEAPPAPIPTILPRK